MERPPAGAPRRARLARSERTLLGVLLALVVFLGGVAVGARSEPGDLRGLPDPVRRLLLGTPEASLTEHVIRILERRYYRPVDAQRLERASVRALLASLGDPYTGYLDPEALRAERQRIRGVYVGVGIALGTRAGAVTVQQVYPRSPAARAGLRPGDRVRTVDGRPLPANGVHAAVARITGPVGSTVRLEIARAGARRSVTLRRERVRVPAVRSRLVRRAGRTIGVVDLIAFTAEAASEVRRAVAGLRGRGARALVLDLRGDPGGLLDEAIAVAGVFLPRGSVVAVTEGEHDPRRVLRTDDAPAAGDLPLVVLVDGASASASEVLAGALRDAGRARLAGTRTFGKALVQSTVPLPDGGALRLTVARYLTPRGQDLQGTGLRPGLAAADDPDTPADEALERALAAAAAAA